MINGWRFSFCVTSPGTDFPVNLRYHLFSLVKIPVEEIEARARAYAGLMAFKFVLRQLLKATIVANIPDESRDMLWRYILAHIPTEDTDRLITEAEEISYTEQEGGRMRSVADELESRGMKRGLVKRRNLFWNSCPAEMIWRDKRRQSAMVAA